jgi:hypothetical protein
MNPTYCDGTNSNSADDGAIRKGPQNQQARFSQNLLKSMSTEKQRAAAKKNIKKAAATAESKQTISHLPAKTQKR